MNDSVVIPVGAGGDGDLQAAYTATLVDEWIRGGLRHAVVCPGSRSAPMARALADRNEVVVHVRLDERSAGFSALGVGLATGVPAVILTTSGTAAAEVHAAVVEADLAGVPLLVVTADRPPELRGVGAPQTIDQHSIYGSSTRWFCDPGVPDGQNASTWRSLAGRAFAETTSAPGGPGPVHLNLPFREPLLGDPSRVGGITDGRADQAPWYQVVAPPSDVPEEVLARWTQAWGGGSTRGLLLASDGCGNPEDVLALGSALGWPVLADPRSGLRSDAPGVVSCADSLLRSAGFAAGHRPDVIVRLGAPWASKVVMGFVTSAIGHGAFGVVADPHGRWGDPQRSNETWVRADPGVLARRLSAMVAGTGEATGAPSRWEESWLEAETLARVALARELDGPASLIDEPTLARRLFQGLPAGATLVVSSSMPIRDVESFSGVRRGALRVLANRGANGIDGVVSTALGVSWTTEAETVVLVGDLAFLHDTTALLRSPGDDPRLTVVVADNGGGGIFSFLPPAEALESTSFEHLFGTPQAVDVSEVGRAFGWSTSEVVDWDGEIPPGSILRVRLPDRRRNVERHQELHGAVIEALAEGSG